MVWKVGNLSILRGVGWIDVLPVAIDALEIKTLDITSMNETRLLHGRKSLLWKPSV